MTALRARITLLAAALVSFAFAGRLAADRIAYQGRFGTGPRNIIVMTDQGMHPVPLGKVPGAEQDKMTPALSPDGKMIAFSARVQGNYDIFVWELDKFGNTTGEPKHLTTSDANEEQPAWSPDGKQLAYVSAKEPDFGLYVMNADGSVQRKIADLTKKTYRITSPTWSPDSTNIAYCKDGELWIAPAGGAEPKKMADDGWYPAWSPDGKHIAAFARQPTDSLVLYDPEGKLANTLLRFVRQFGQIAWSSDGKQLTFTAGEVGGKAGALWTVPVEGLEVAALKSYGQVHGYISRAASPAVVMAERPGAPESPAAAETAPAGPAMPPAPAAATPPAVSPPLPSSPPSRVAAAPAQPARTPATTAPKTRPAAKKPARAAARPAPPKPSRSVQVVVPPPPLPALPGPEGPVRMVTPADGAKVRGQPTLVAAKTNDEGYVTFEVQRSSEARANFQWATIAPYQYQWDTRLLPDGDYTLRAIGFDAAGQREGTAQIRVAVENGLPSAALGDQGTLFRLRLNPQEVWDKKIRASATFVGGTMPENLRRLTGTLDAAIAQKVDSVTRDGSSATVVTRVEDAELSLGGVRTPLAEGLHAARLTVTPMGKIVPPPSVLSPHRIGLGELYVVLPQQRVKVGDAWTAPMTYIAELINREVREVAAHNRIVELKWQNEVETAHIVSSVTWPSIPLIEGLQLTSVSIKRDTWFAYKQGKILRMEDTITARLSGAPATPSAGLIPRPMVAPPAGWAGLREQLFQQESERERRRGFGGTLQIRPPVGGLPGVVAPAPRPVMPTTPTAPRPVAVPELTYTFTLITELAQ